MKYDFLIVGAGIFGSVFARQALNNGYSCMVIDKRSHIAGNCYTETKNGINIHKYGPHAFHTNSKKIWSYVNTFADFNNYQHRIKVNYDSKIYSFPINLLTLYQLFGVSNPNEAREHINSARVRNDKPNNLEEFALDKVGKEIYEIFIKGYTSKQWNKDPRDLPPSIIKRIPIRLDFNDNYFEDQYQGIPIGGYTKMFENILHQIPTHLDVDYFKDRDKFDSMAHKIVYTGAIDEFFNYELGELEWRSLRFEEVELDTKDYQGSSIINYTSENIPHTRIVEHKHFENKSAPTTIITKEYPQNYSSGLEKFYPVNTKVNMDIYHKYKSKINNKKYIFGGRLAEYKYYDMHQVFGSALSCAEKELSN